MTKNTKDPTSEKKSPASASESAQNEKRLYTVTFFTTGANHADSVQPYALKR